MVGSGEVRCGMVPAKPSRGAAGWSAPTDTPTIHQLPTCPPAHHLFHLTQHSLGPVLATTSSCPPQLVPEESLLSAAARNFFINVLSGPLASQPVDGVPLEPTELTPAARALGWRRMALQILYIVPGDLRDPRK